MSSDADKQQINLWEHLRKLVEVINRKPQDVPPKTEQEDESC